MAANRYSGIPTTKNANGNRVTTSVIYPTINAKVGDTYIITKTGDSLDSIAYEFYGDPNQWWILAQVNALGKGSLKVPPGIQLIIPANPSDLRDQLNNENIL